MEAIADELLAGPFTQLRSITESLQCQICTTTFQGPVMLSCGHSFCSACIRANIDFKASTGAPQSCPSCRRIHEGPLIANYALRETATAFLRLLPDLKALVEAASKPAPAAAAVQPKTKHPAAPSTRKRKSDHPEVLVIDNSDGSDAEETVRHQHTTKRQHSGGTNDPASNEPAAQQGADAVLAPAPAVDTGVVSAHPTPHHTPANTPHQAATQNQGRAAEGCVACPLCGMSINQALINTHLDVCLDKPSSTQAAPTSIKHPRPRPQHRSSNTGSQAGGPAHKPDPNLGHPASRPASNHIAPPQPVPVPGSSLLKGSSSSSLRLSEADIPSKLVLTVLKDKELRGKLKQLGLPGDGTRPELEARYQAYRRYLQSKLDAGTSMELSQLRASFLAQHSRQAAVRKASPAMQLGSHAVGGLGSMLAAGRHNHAAGHAGHSNGGGGGAGRAAGEGGARDARDTSPEVVDLDAEEDGRAAAGLGQGGGRAKAAAAGHSFDDLIHNVIARKQKAKTTSPGGGSGGGGASTDVNPDAAGQTAAPCVADELAGQPDSTGEAAEQHTTQQHTHHQHHHSHSQHHVHHQEGELHLQHGHHHHHHHSHQSCDLLSPTRRSAPHSTTAAPLLDTAPQQAPHQQLLKPATTPSHRAAGPAGAGDDNDTKPTSAAPARGPPARSSPSPGLFALPGQAVVVHPHPHQQSGPADAQAYVLPPAHQAAACGPTPGGGGVTGYGCHTWGGVTLGHSPGVVSLYDEEFEDDMCNLDQDEREGADDWQYGLDEDIDMD